jgi:hypothetical protein
MENQNILELNFDVIFRKSVHQGLSWMNGKCSFGISPLTFQNMKDTKKIPK